MERDRNRRRHTLDTKTPGITCLLRSPNYLIDRIEQELPNEHLRILMLGDKVIASGIRHIPEGTMGVVWKIESPDNENTDNLWVTWFSERPSDYSNINMDQIQWPKESENAAKNMRPLPLGDDC